MFFIIFSFIFNKKIGQDVGERLGLSCIYYIATKNGKKND